MILTMNSSSQLEITSFALGPFQTNCFVVAATDGSAWLVDVGDTPGPMLAYVAEHELAVEKIVLTHAHADHIAGLSECAGAVPGRADFDPRRGA